MRPISFLMICFYIALVTGCSLVEGNINGSVFIVTKGAENYKLGLVKITAISESEISRFVEQKKKAVSDSVATLRQQAESLKPDIDLSQKAFDDANKNYETVNGQREAAKSRQDAINAQYNPYLVEIDPYLAEFETPADIAERNRQRSLGKQLAAAKKEVATFDKKLVELGKIRSDANSRLSAIKAKSAELLTKMASNVDPAVLFDGIPEGSQKAVSDADGKFSFKLPKGKYALYASAQRRVFTTTEEYHWLIWVQVDNNSPNIILSNQNLLGSDSDDSIFKLKELIPSQESHPADQTASFNT